MPHDFEYEAFLKHDRERGRKLLADINATIAKLQAPAKAMTSEERLALFVEILQGELQRLEKPWPVPIARIGMGGVDRLAQRLLAERGVQSILATTADQYRSAVRDVLEQLRTGRLSPLDLGYSRRYSTSPHI